MCTVQISFGCLICQVLHISPYWEHFTLVFQLGSLAPYIYIYIYMYIRSHLRRTFQTKRTFFHPDASKVSCLFIKSLGLCLQVVSATSEPTSLNKYYEKHPTLDLSTTEDDFDILTPCLGDAIISIGFRKNFPRSQNGY